MGRTTNITDHRLLPAGMIALVHDVIHDYFQPLEGGDDERYKLKHYAGEFLAEDNLNRLKAEVSQFPHVMYDIETIEGTDIDDSQTMPEDLFRFIIFCCHSNRFDESIQWSSSYELAWDVKRAFQGVSFNNMRDIHANGYFEPQTIERELHVPGMSVHTFRMDATVVHDVKGQINLDIQGGFLFNAENTSHYLGLLGGGGALRNI